MAESTETPSKRKGWGEALAAYLEPRLIAVLFMGFASGLPLALTGATLQIRQTEAKVDLTTIGFFALVAVSYSLKFLWSPMIDRSPPPGPFARLGQRRGWGVLFQLALMVSITILGAIDPATSPTLVAAFAAVVAFCSASQDIVLDAYRIELLDDNQQGAGSAMTQYGYRVGMLASGAGALFIAEYVSWFAAYTVMGALMTVGLATLLLTREPKVDRPTDPGKDSAGLLLQVGAIAAVTAAAILVFFLVRLIIIFVFPVSPVWVPNMAATLTAAAVPIVIFYLLPSPGRDTGAYARLHRWLNGALLQPFADMASRQGWVAILVFIVLFKLGDAICGGMANPFYISIGFTKPQIAEISKVFGLLATMLGVFLGGLLNLRLGVGRALLISGILQLASNFMFVLQATVGSNETYLYATIGLENLTGGMGSAAFVAYLSMLCNISFTGTQYALFSSLAAVGRTVLSAPFGAVAEEVGWVDYFIISAFMALPGLILLIWMLRRYPVSAQKAPVTT